MKSHAQDLACFHKPIDYCRVNRVIENLAKQYFGDIVSYRLLKSYPQATLWLEIKWDGHNVNMRETLKGFRKKEVSYQIRK